MKQLLLAAAVAVAAIAAGGTSVPTAARAETGVSVSFSYFRTSLAPHGRWFSHPRYGWTWRPHGIAAGWRPYTSGRWAWTDDHGWMWVSYEDWGWATYHYGRWVYEPSHGWYWVPGYTWGPAWVAWRHGDGFVGWYPLPPEAVWDPDAGIAYGGVGVYGAYYTPYWVFVPERQFLSTRIHTVVVRSHDNARFIRNTRRSLRYGHAGRRVFNHGIDRSYIARMTGRRIEAVRPRVVTGRGDWRKSGPGAREVRILRPPAVERRAAVPGGRGGSVPGTRRDPAPGAKGSALPRPRGAAPQPRVQPREQPRAQPRIQPREQRRVQPRIRPREQPRVQPRAQPKVDPRLQPRAQPRVEPRYQPKAQPRYQPRAQPRVEPRLPPRAQPRHQPPAQPRVVPGAGGRGHGGPPPQPRGQPNVRRDGGGGGPSGGATYPRDGGSGAGGGGGRRWR